MTHSDDVTTTIQPIQSTLGRRLKAVRLAWGWAQEEVAEILRVDQASISFWERDKIRPSGSAVVALAALFRTTVDALETGENFVVPEPPKRGDGHRNARALPRGVCLPVGQSEKVAIVDLSSGVLSTPPLSQAIISLGQYFHEGRKIWIVVE